MTTMSVRTEPQGVESDLRPRGINRNQSNGTRARSERGSTMLIAGKMTIVVIDRRVLIRDCLVKCLRTTDAIHNVVAFTSAEEWRLAAADHPTPAVIVLSTEGRKDVEIEQDIALLSNGMTIPIIIVSDAEDVDHILSALDSGARGYIPTSVTLDVAVEAMRLVEAGGTFIPANSFAARRRKADSAESDEQQQKSVFTTRQTAVLTALQKGQANKQIAYALNMQEGTVKVHIRNIMKKLNAKNRTEVAILTRDMFVGSSDL